MSIALLGIRSAKEDTARGITEILKSSAHEEGKCVIVVTHSNSLAEQADIIFRLKRGNYIEKCKVSKN